MIRNALVSATILLFAASCSPCNDAAVNFSESCVLPSMASDLELEVEMREACGSSCSEPPACIATVDLNTVSIVAAQSECASPDCKPDGACRRRTVKCLLPRMGAGEYTIVIPGVAPRTLVVEPGAPASCTL